MTDRTGRRVNAIELLVTLSLLVAAPGAVLLGATPTATAGPCDQVGGVIIGDWTITTAQTCSGIVYTVDGSVTINAGGSLTLLNGGLLFAKDESHASYALTINAGGELVLNNSIVTTQTAAIDPYLKLALSVNGAGARLTMRNGAMLKFPGWFNVTGGTLDIWDSTITGFTSDDLQGLGIYQDDNDDAPLLNWVSTTAALYRSRIERVYENASAASGNATGPIAGNVDLRSGSGLYAYDSYIGVDYSNVVGLHNELRVDATSNAYLYGVTIDRSQDPVSMSNWQPAFVPQAAGGTVYLLRWLRLTALDETGFPVSGATVWSTLSPSATTAQYPDNAMSSTPSTRTLNYLRRTGTGGTAWNVTNATGEAAIPLYTDQITTATLPNAESFGNYQETVRFTTYTVTSGVDFDPFPVVDAIANNEIAAVTFAGLQVRTGPDLAVRQSDYTSTVPVIQNQPFQVDVAVYNMGQTTATSVSVAVYLDGDRGTELGRRDGLTVSTFVGVTLDVSAIATLGAHTLMVVADPDNTYNEGGPVQEANNYANITLDVRPPPEGSVAILTPTPNQRVEPGTQLSVTGYVRDDSAVGIGGLPLTIEVRSGTTVLTNTTISQSDGFFIGTVPIPSDAPEGSYTLTVTPAAGTIQPGALTLEVRRPMSFWNTVVPFLGLPVWIVLLIALVVIGLVAGSTLYFKVYGLGKMVECGECGSFIPQDSTKCPKCGVEFEKEMAKCSNCQAWIPVDVKQCPECGVEFATGKVEMADYQQKMRMQYDEVVTKFKRLASQQLGRALSDAEFQDWWRKQPTFVTFEDWLREEEEMRKMGSKPCPVCTTLNSVTATVCHKCGTYLKGERRAPPPGPVRRPVAAEPDESEPAPTDPVPAKVVRKPAPSIPDLPKKGQSGDDTSVDDI